MRVLVVTHSRDTYVPDRVADALRARGARPLRLDTDRFPGDVRAGLSRSPDGAWVSVDGERVSLDDVGAVWIRRHWPPAPVEGLEEAMVTACRHESMAALEGVLLTAKHARFVNAIEADHAASRKLRQLQVAQAVGLAVPPTLVTNDPDEVRAFCALHPATITKLVAVDHVGGSRAYTRRLTAADLDELDGLQLAPILVQAELDKRVELRVAVVGGACFAGGMRAGVGEGPVDWRHPSAPDMDWEPAALDPSVAERLVALTGSLGLVYGAVDLVVGPDGGCTFLEINPCGEWGMLEHTLGLPVADALARALVG